MIKKVIGYSLLVLVCGLFVFMFVQDASYAKNVVVDDPWTVKAATFNPSGVKWQYGVTTGNELKGGYVPVYQEAMKQSVVDALAKNKVNDE